MKRRERYPYADRKGPKSRFDGPRGGTPIVTMRGGVLGCSKLPRQHDSEPTVRASCAEPRPPASDLL